MPAPIPPPHPHLFPDECDHIIKAATPRLERSGVVEVEGRGRDGVSDVRTSYGMFFDRKEDPVLARVENRLSEATMIPVGHGEGIQVLRYENGQEYKPHFDYFFREAGDGVGKMGGGVAAWGHELRGGTWEQCI